MKYVGAHVSTQGGVENAPLNASKINAKGFALFLKNQRRWEAPPYTSKNILAFKDNCKQFKFTNDDILAHDSYLINLGHPDKISLEKSRVAFLDETSRADQLELKTLNFHPGSHLREISERECLKKIAESLNIISDKTKNIIFVLENTAGQGSNLGYRFEHLKEIIEQVEDKDRVGVCLDTCHLFASGYDLRTEEDCQYTFTEFDKIVGFKYLKGMHLNDSKALFNSKKDRHHSLNHGEIGLDAFKYIMKDSRFDNIPLILETIDDNLWIDEINMLYSFCD